MTDVTSTYKYLLNAGADPHTIRKMVQEHYQSLFKLIVEQKIDGGKDEIDPIEHGF